MRPTNLPRIPQDARNCGRPRDQQTMPPSWASSVISAEMRRTKRKVSENGHLTRYRRFDVLFCARRAVRGKRALFPILMRNASRAALETGDSRHGSAAAPPGHCRARCNNRLLLCGTAASDDLWPYCPFPLFMAANQSRTMSRFGSERYPNPPQSDESPDRFCRRV